MTALQMERWGVTNQRQMYFYDGNTGAWELANWLISAGQDPLTGDTDPNSPLPAFLAMNMQLRGTTFQSEINFGAAADYVRGYQFFDGTVYKTVLFTSASSSLPISISGFSSAVDVYGNSINLGTGNFNLTDLPIYVTSAAPLVVNDFCNGLRGAINVATTATPTAPGLTQTNLNRTNDGLLNSGYITGFGPGPDNTSDSPYADFTYTMPATITWTWGSQQTIARLGIFSVRAWQFFTCLTEFHVDAFISGQWTTIYSYSNPTAKTVPFVSYGTSTPYETYYNNEWIVHYKLPAPIQTTALRLVATKTSWGDQPDSSSFYSLRFPQGTVPHLSLNDFRAYSN